MASIQRELRSLKPNVQKEAIKKVTFFLPFLRLFFVFGEKRIGRSPPLLSHYVSAHRPKEEEEEGGDGKNNARNN